MQTAEQHHQLGAVNAVPQEGGQEEEVKQRRHRRARARVRLHVLLGGQDRVGFHVGILGDFVGSCEVCHPGEEGDDEGQQGEVDAEKHDPRLRAAPRVSGEVEEAEKFRRSYSNPNMAREKTGRSWNVLHQH